MQMLSIVIPAFNEENYLAHTLEQIGRALHENRRRSVTWEVVVCDNNSTDRTPEIAAQAGARVVFEPVNQMSRARNTGAEPTRGEWLLFIDADTHPSPELMAEVFDVMEDGRFLGCGATVLVEGGTLFNKLRMERLNPLFRLFNWSGAAFLSCRADAFRSVGGFSTKLYALEEIDFLLRLKRHGRKTGQQFKVLHQHPVVTSGRKGEYGFLSLGVLFLSDFFAVLLFGLHYILPERWTALLGSSLLGYWYGGRR